MVENFTREQLRNAAVAINRHTTATKEAFANPTKMSRSALNARIQNDVLGWDKAQELAMDDVSALNMNLTKKALRKLIVKTYCNQNNIKIT
ncbi:MAG: hypothetical protein AAB786_02670 [Patescibacteria group bacterium]